MTDQQKANVASILRLARGYITEVKQEAVHTQDFDTSMRIASNEARVEAYFRERGIEPDTKP